LPGRVLIAGESWIIRSIHIKGFDSFTTHAYEEGVQWLRGAVEEAGYTVEFMPNHLVPAGFPCEVRTLQRYGAVIFSDVGANSLLLHPASFAQSRRTPNRLDLLAEYVGGGGGFLMIGGYMSFAGIDGKARYAGTAVEQILPVQIATSDDRVELPQGREPQVTAPDHPVMRDMPRSWPAFLGYNRVTAKHDAEILMRCGDDPFLVAGTWGSGRTMAFASDCGPHWAPPPFLEWECHNRFWGRILNWLCRAGG